MTNSSENDQSDVLMEALTRREHDVLVLLVKNLSNREIAAALTIEPDSVKWYTKQIYGKLGVHDRQQAVTRARQLGLVESETAQTPPSPCNLPAALTTFIGREHDLEQVGKMLANPTHRLITLTGAGGVGKTRLALRLAENACTRNTGEVWLIELAAISNPEMVIETVNATLGLHVEKDQTPLMVLQNHLRSRKMLLVLDNCEHLVEACASLSESLLKTCPGLQILATSREALGINGEIPYCVPSLSIPECEDSPNLEQLFNYEAVALFIERGQNILPGFALTPENAKAITRICQRLDGIPLAIELAAARIKVLSVAQLANRLEESFALLSGGSRTALSRHQTMNASIEWSYSLMGENEQLLLQRLSVFAGGWTLQAAEQICANAALPEEIIFDTLTQLIQRSLVRVEYTPAVRYFLLEMVRQFAWEKLCLAGDHECFRQRHLEWFLDFAETAEEKIFNGNESTNQKQVESDFGNLQAALQWSLAERANPEMGLHIAHALTFCLWNRDEHRSEGCHWLKMGLDIPSLPLIVQVHILRSLAYLDSTASPMKRIAWMENARKLCEQVGNDGILDAAAALSWEGLIEALDLGNLHRGLSLIEQGEALLRQLGEPGRMHLYIILERKSYILSLLGENAQALVCAHEATILGQEDNNTGLTMELRLLGERAIRQGDFTSARQHFEKAKLMAQLSRNPMKIANANKKMGDFEKAQGNYEQAYRIYCETLQIYESVGWLIQPRSFAWLLENLVINEVSWATKKDPLPAKTHYLRAACILGVEQTLLEKSSLPMFVEQSQEYDQAIRTLQTMLSLPELENARAEGRAMTVGEAVKFIVS